MATSSVLVSVEEYLRSSYRPDRDYVEGELLERNMGEKPHSRLQKLLLRFLEQYEETLSVEALPEQRLQINSRRFRVPDLMLIRSSDTETRIVRDPPLVCVEILSSEDRMSSIEERVQDYAGLGVQSTWVVDPWRGLAYQAGSDGVLFQEKEFLRVTGLPVQVGVAGMFAELDRLQDRAQAQKNLGLGN